MRIPLANLGLARTAITAWGEADPRRQRRLARLISRHPQFFPVITQTRVQKEVESRTEVADSNLTHLGQKYQDAVEAGYHTVDIESSGVNDMARHLEAGLGYVALGQGLSIEEITRCLSFAAYSEDEYARG